MPRPSPELLDLLARSPLATRAMGSYYRHNDPATRTASIRRACLDLISNGATDLEPAERALVLRFLAEMEIEVRDA